ncbi:MAG: hypothetical protein M3Y74_19110, partial [Chloroflexota bacterium]|nr:hypothetical protein [Chloroflexota bacterium]
MIVLLSHSTRRCTVTGLPSVYDRTIDVLQDRRLTWYADFPNSVLSVLFFALLHAQPGGACAYILATPGPNAQTRFNACIVSRGLDQPLPVQYLKWVGATLHLDLGQDYTGQAVIDTIKLRLPATIILIGLAYIVQQLIAIPLG